MNDDYLNIIYFSDIWELTNLVLQIRLNVLSYAEPPTPGVAFAIRYDSTKSAINPEPTKMLRSFNFQTL